MVDGDEKSGLEMETLAYDAAEGLVSDLVGGGAHGEEPWFNIGGFKETANRRICR